MPLPKVEVVFNFTAWTCAVFYSLYKFYVACGIFKQQEDVYHDFSTGWIISNRKKDSSDIEWEIMHQVLQILAPWCLLQVTVAEILKLTKFFKPHKIYFFHLVTSLLFILLNIHPVLVLLILFQPILFRLVYMLKHSPLLWLCWLTCLALFTALKFYPLLDYIENCTEQEYFITNTGIFWLNLKCFSYFHDKLQEHNVNKECKKSKKDGVDDIEFLAFCLYLPTLFCGPFISVIDYRKGAMCSSNENVQKRIRRLFFNLCRIAFWALFVEFALHYIYVNPMMYQLEHVKTFDSWTIYGYGYAMGQYFHIKYFIVYGFSLAFAEFENIPVPEKPKCIGRIHVYSDMWKHFDQGFYNFMLRYLYIPLVGKERTFARQIGANFVCFFFVYIWHGIEFYILIWTAINFFCVSMERCFNMLLTTALARRLVQRLNDRWQQRLHGVVAAPLLAIAAMSNSYFFAGSGVGDIFFAKFFTSSIGAKLTLFVLLYFCCQVSIETRNWERKRKIKIN